jgi:hypothetical protein
MVPSSIRPPHDYRPLLQPVGKGLYELVNAYEGTYHFFARSSHLVEPENPTSPPVTLRILRPPPGDFVPLGDD